MNDLFVLNVSVYVFISASCNIVSFILFLEPARVRVEPPSESIPAGGEARFVCTVEGAKPSVSAELSWAVLGDRWKIFTQYDRYCVK